MIAQLGDRSAKPALPRSLVSVATAMFLIGLGGCNTTDADLAAQLEQHLAKRRDHPVRAQCRQTAHGLRACRVEEDPGSGWSGWFHLRVLSGGCWVARRVRYDGERGRPYSNRYLSLGDAEATGPLLRSCKSR